METLNVRYSYRGSDEEKLENFLIELEKEIGGEREPYFAKWGALDLVAYLTIGVGLVIGAAFKKPFDKYFEGLFNGDRLKELGERHRVKVAEWFSILEKEITKVVQSAALVYNKGSLKAKLNNDGKAFVIQIFIDSHELFIVLNHNNLSFHELINLPKGIVSALHYLFENGIIEDSTSFQLYFDHLSKKWKYLFVPTAQAFGKWIDRYVDLDTGIVRLIKSQNEFVETFNPSYEDRNRFLIDPFRL